MPLQRQLFWKRAAVVAVSSVFVSSCRHLVASLLRQGRCFASHCWTLSIVFAQLKMKPFFFQVWSKTSAEDSLKQEGAEVPLAKTGKRK